MIKEFAFRTQISAWIFAIAGTLAILIALITVSSQAIKAALSDPGSSLKKE